MAARTALASKRAVLFLKTYYTEGPPIAIDDLARAAGASLHFKPFEGKLSGFLHRPSHGLPIIAVNSNEHEHRQRFTIAHELGHLVLHTGSAFHIDERFPIWFRGSIASKGVDDEEIEANQFAAEVLMPERMLLDDVKSLPADVDIDEAITRLASTYCVSTQAMAIRLSRLGAV